MPQKPAYEELGQRVMEIEKEVTDCKRAHGSLGSERGKSQALMDRLACTEVGLLIKQLICF